MERRSSIVYGSASTLGLGKLMVPLCFVLDFVLCFQIQDMDLGDQMNFDTDLPQPPQDNNQVRNIRILTSDNI